MDLLPPMVSLQHSPCHTPSAESEQAGSRLASATTLIMLKRDFIVSTTSILHPAG